MKMLQKGIWAGLIGLLTGLSFEGMAQQELQSSTYFMAPMPFNPAYTGLSEQLNVRSMSRMQWLGWSGAPKSHILTIDAPFMRKSAGAGMTLIQDNVGARTSTLATVSGAAHLPLSDDWTMSFGLSGGMRFHAYDFTNLRAEDPSDELYQTVFRDWSPSFGAGLYATSSKAYVGFSVPQILVQSLSDSTDTDVLQRHHYVMAGLKKNYGQGVTLQYGVLAKATVDAPPAVDFQALLMYHDEIGFGGHFRWGESLGFMLRLKLSSALSAAYLVEMPWNSLRTQNFGTHELALRWNFKSPEVVMNNRFF